MHYMRSSIHANIVVWFYKRCDVVYACRHIPVFAHIRMYGHTTMQLLPTLKMATPICVHNHKMLLDELVCAQTSARIASELEFILELYLHITRFEVDQMKNTTCQNGDAVVGHPRLYA